MEREPASGTNEQLREIDYARLACNPCDRTEISLNPPSVSRMAQLENGWTGFHEMSYRKIVVRIVEPLQYLFRWDNFKTHFH
jgi:hypothetical protein